MLYFLLQNGLHLVALGILLVTIAFFSGAETALFTLGRHQLNTFRTGGNPLLRLAARLMDRPQQTLVAILLGNMAVNVLFFSSASVLVIEASQRLARWQSTIAGFVPALAIIFFGGVLPKVVAASYPTFVASVVAAPLYTFERVARPLCTVLQRFVITPGVRLLTPPEKAARPISHEELQELLQHSAAQGVLAPGESVLLREVVELGTIKVREIAVPRVDLVTFDIGEGREAFLDLVRQRGLNRIPAWRDDPDHIVGMLSARDVLLKTDDPLEDLLHPVWFVPETKTIDSLLRDFQESGRESAIAVDEFGGVTGLITLEDVIAEVVGDVFRPEEAPEELVRQIGDDAYLISGRLSIREWAETFGQPFRDATVDTVGGLITTRLGRMARLGDTLKLRNLVFVVTKTHRHRVVEVRLERLSEAGPGPKEPQG